ncbi:MAG: hypothetical protein NUW23_11110 [Firmicutes bacterium]|nr:hypothetical protein [Bacillota bacterium]
MRLHHLAVPLIAVIAFFGVVGMGVVTGTWSTTGRAPVLASDSQALGPDDLKGWMSLTEVAGWTRLPLEALIRELGLPEAVDTAVRMSNLEKDVPGFEVSDVREAVGRLQAQGVREGSTAGTAAPSGADSVGSTTGGQGSGAGPGAESAGQGTARGAQGTGAGPESAASPSDIKGRMTLHELSRTFGIPLELLISEAGLPADVNPSLSLRQINEAHGVETSDVRAAVERILKSKSR